MIKQHFRYRNFMIVFEDDRYYICKASSFSKNGTNRYNWKDIETIDDAKKIIDKYWKDNEEVTESMVKYVKESKDEDLEVLNELEDEELEEVTNPSNIGSHKRSPLAIRRNKKSKKSDESVCNEDRIVTKDDELNKPTNVKDDDTDNDTIDINVSTNDTNTDNTSNDNNSDEQQEDEVILTEVSDFEKSRITIEKDAKIESKYGIITINRVYAHWNPFENRVETKVDIEVEKDGKKSGYDTIPVEKIYTYLD